jgi:uncharacterized Ntn-hydrolase superfamily protein
MSAVRQVGMVDAAERAAAYTGASAIAEAGHIAEDGISVQANRMLRTDRVAGDARGVQVDSRRTGRSTA